MSLNKNKLWEAVPAGLPQTWHYDHRNPGYSQYTITTSTGHTVIIRVDRPTKPDGDGTGTNGVVYVYDDVRGFGEDLTTNVLNDVVDQVVVVGGLEIEFKTDETGGCAITVVDGGELVGQSGEPMRGLPDGGQNPLDISAASAIPGLAGSESGSLGDVIIDGSGGLP